MTDRKKSEGVTMEYNLDVVFSKKFYDQIDWYSHNYIKEIGGFIIGEVKDGVAYCEDIIYPKQHVSSGEVEFKKGSIGLLRKQEGEEKIAKIIGEWHSHNSLGCFWSGVDETLMSEFMMDFKLGIFVVSSKGNHLVRAETSKPWATMIDNLEYTVEEELEVVEEKAKLLIEFEELNKKINAFNFSEKADLKSKLIQIVEDKVEAKVYPKVVTKGYKDWADYSDDDWAEYENRYNDNYLEPRPEFKQQHLDLDRNYQIYDMLSTNKDTYSISLNNVNPDWQEELETTFGVEMKEDLIDRSLGMTINCSNKQQFREVKKEVKGLVKLLIEEQEDTDYFSGK